MEQWSVVKPGGPAGPFWGIVSSSGRVIAMQIPDESIARQIVALREQLAEFGKSPAGVTYRLAVDILSADFEQALAILRTERDDLRTQLDAANAELYELRIRAGRRRSGEPQRRRT